MAARMNIECLQIEPTTRCNFRCGFCVGRSMEQSDLDIDLFTRTLDQFPSVQHLELQGEGEPLMHPRFFDMVAIARARGVRVSFISNGSWFTPAHIERILEGGVEKISVSLESADAEAFRAIRGGKLEKVIAGLEALMSERNRRGLAKPAVGFSVTLMRRTRGHLPAILALYRRLGLDGGFSAQPLQHMAAYRSIYDASMREETLDAAEADARLLNLLVRTQRGTMGFYDVLMAGWRPASKKCPWLEKGLYVDRNGGFSPCCMIKETGTRDEVLAQREEMRAQMACGEMPHPCGGCEIARYAVIGRLELARRLARAGLRVLQG
jgi:MoaA/NifB/PqqE/SkfB family radical SAM enzyme